MANKHIKRTLHCKPKSCSCHRVKGSWFNTPVEKTHRVAKRI